MLEQWINSTNKQLLEALEVTDQIERTTYTIDQSISDFLIFESRSDSFYVSEENVLSQNIEYQFQQLEHLSSRLAAFSNVQMNSQPSLQDIEKFIGSATLLKKDAIELIELRTYRGHRDFGMIGRMRKAIHAIENDIDGQLAEQLLSIRRDEKDFLLRKDTTYLVSHAERLQTFENYLKSSTLNFEELLDLLTEYEFSFAQVASVEQKIGTPLKRGLKHKVREDLEHLISLLNSINAKVRAYHQQVNHKLFLYKVSAYIIGLIFIIGSGLFFHFRFIQPMQRFTSRIRNLQSGQTDHLPNELAVYHLQNEVSELALAMRDLLNKVDQQKERLAHAVIDAQEANRVKSEFLSTMSHEIRTPLNAVVNIISDLSESDQLAAHHKEDIDILRSSTDYLIALVSDILDLNKIDEGKLRLSPKKANLHELLQTVDRIFSQRASHKNISYRSSWDKDIVPEWVLIDSVRLNQVLYNLLGNAIKFTTEGEVFFGLNVLEKSAIRTSIEFSISDTGIGIKDNDKKRIFQRFSQANSSNNRNFGGSGLGLNISQSLVELMGNRIAFESEWQKGSRFYFSLDLLHASHEEMQANSAGHDKPTLPFVSAKPKAQSIKILVVDDNAVNLRIATKVMSKAGYDVETAIDGQIAVDMVQANTYDLILMDLQMPVLDGFEATKRIRALGHEAEYLPIIAVSASALVESKDQAFLSGMNDYLCKPFRPAELLDLVQKHLNKQLMTG